MRYLMFECNFNGNAFRATEELQGEPHTLRQVGVVGTIGGVVKCVDIYRNAEGEIRQLGLF